MSSKIFLDSSILIGKTKGTKNELYDHLASNRRYEKCISEVVLSEFTFYLLIIEGGKAPLTLKRDGAITGIINQHNPVALLKTLSYLEPDGDIIPFYLRFMEQYNLLPNDALILATCTLNNVLQLASYDADFVSACLNEGIQLVQQVSDLV